MRWIAFVAAWIAAPALALPVTLTWELATWDDGTPIDPADVVAHQVQWTGACPGFGWVGPQNDHRIESGATTLKLDDITPGSRCFRVRVFVRDPECTQEPCVVDSEWSEPWSATFPLVQPVPARTPLAPTGLSGN